MNDRSHRLNKDFDYLFKIVLIGDSNVGKSQLLSRFSKDAFNLESRATIGVEFATKTMTKNEKQLKVQIWDTAGQEKYRAMASSYYRGASGVLIIFDITKRSSFENVTTWLDEVRNQSKEGVEAVLIGNKSDLQNQRTVSQEEAE